MESETDLSTGENKLRQILINMYISVTLLIFHCFAVAAMVK